MKSKVTGFSRISIVFSIGLLLGALVLFFVIPGFAAGEPAASPAAALQDKPDAACALLDDPAARVKMSGMFETTLLYACDRADELGGVPSPASPVPVAPLLGADVQVNDSTGESGPTATQSETSIARNETTGTLCSGYNDAYSGVVLGLGFTGFSSSTDGGATWVDRGALDATSGGDPSMIWRRSDGKFYFAALRNGGLGIWRSDDDCETFVFHADISPGPSSDDKELMAVDNNVASPYYGRIYTAWTDFGAGAQIYSTYSDDGLTWSTQVAVSAVLADVQGAWPAVAPNGDVYISWVRWNPYPTGPIDIEVVRSTDGGVSYSPVTNPLTGAVNPRDNTATITCLRPALNANIRYLPSPQIVVSPNGHLHIVYSYDPDGFNTGDVINVYYRRSTDNGATWDPEVLLNDDGTTTDQWFPTVSAGPSGRIVTTWYDRRSDAGNNLFEYYMRVSEDGGATWQPNVLVSDVQSPVYIDPGLATCYHGDYDTQIQDASYAYIQWSDDRNILSAHNDPDVWFDKEIFGADFTLDAAPLTQDVCIPNDAVYDIAVGSIMGFSDNVTLSTASTPAGTTSSFSLNPVTPPGTSVLTMTTGAAAAGVYNFDVVGTAPTSTHTATVGLNLLDAVPGVSTLVAPPDGAPLVPLAPTFEWTAAAGASSYDLEVATNPGFTTIVYTATVAGTSHTATSDLAAGTLHYWRVTANNACGGGTPSSAFTFTTLVPPSIDLAKTVGTIPAVCATTEAITVTAGTDVYYCYEVTNTGPITLALHDLVDSELGTILDDFAFDLAPGASVDTVAAGLTLSTTLNSTTVNTATWTAFNLPYTYDDTAPYSFIDISGTGTPLGLSDDGEADVTMPFTMDFFGTESDQLCIGNNGGVLFDQSGCSLSFINGALPNASLGLAILPFWDDIDSDTGDVYYESQGSAPNRQFIVQWDDRSHFPGPSVSEVTFELILYEGSNHILFQYQDLDFGDVAYDYGASATVGLNKDGVDAVQYSFNSAVLADNMAILFVPSSGSATAADTALVTVATPEIAVSPQALTSTQAADTQFTYPLSIMNVGLLPLDWSIDEAPAPAPRNQAVEAAYQQDLEAPVVTSEEQCGLYENYAGAEPEGYAEICLGGLASPKTGSLGSRDPTDTAFAQDIGFVSDNFVSHALNDFPGQTVLGPNARPIFAMDFDETGTTLYAMDNNTRELGTYNLATGAFTPIAVVSGIPPADTFSGLTIDPATGTAYVSSLGAAMTLYTMDLGTAVATLIGSDATVPLLIDIAIGPQGVIYGHDIGTDSIYTVDKTTGLVTLVGPTGVASNFAQGMDFDNTDGTLYAYTYQGGGANQYGTIDLATGALTPLAIDNPLGEFEGATQTSGAPSACDAPSDLDWVSVDPISGTTGAGLSTVLDVTFDSTGKSAGVYTGTLCVNSNDLTDPLVEIPLNMIVVGSPSYGVALSPDMAMTGTVGTTVTYTLHITNTGNVADIFDLAAGGNAWTTLVSQSSIFLSPGQAGSFTAMVDVPAGASNNATDTAAITATSQGDGLVSDSTNLTTTAFRQETLLYMPIIPKLYP